MVEREELNPAVHCESVGQPYSRSHAARRTYAIQRRSRIRGTDLPVAVSMSWLGTAPILPGMMYVSDRSADSICETELAFFVTKSSYMCSHRGGKDRASGTCCEACLSFSMTMTQLREGEMWMR